MSTATFQTAQEAAKELLQSGYKASVLTNTIAARFQMSGIEAANIIRQAEGQLEAEKTAPELPEFLSEAQAAEPEVINLDAAPTAMVATTERKYEGFLTVAMRAHARGQRVLPIMPGAKNPATAWKGSFIDTDNTEQWAGHSEQWINECAAKFPNAGVCVVAKPFEFCFIDEDSSDEFRKGYEEFAGEPFPRTFTTESRPNHRQSHWLQNDATRALGNVSQIIIDKKEMFSFRQRNLYVLSEGSPHPSGTFYHIVDDTAAVPMPDKLVAYMRQLKERAQSQQQPRAEHTSSNSATTGDIDTTPNGPKIPYHQHDDTLTKIAGKIHHDEPELGEDELTQRLIAICEARCINYGSDYKLMCQKIAHSIMRYEDKDNRAESWKDRIDQKIQQQHTEEKQREQAQQPTEPPEPVTEYAMTPAEIEAEFDKPYPVFRLVEQGGPTWDDDIMYGIAGQVVRKAAEYNEAHPAGMYLDFLVSMGSIFGRHAYFNVNSTAHYTNEFMARIGLSSESRKGSGRDAIDEILKLVDSKWYVERVKGGFGSAQAIISELKDAVEQQVFSKKTGLFKTVNVPGVTDKRLCVREGELASVFQLAGMPDSRADIVLRDGWDGKALYNIVKGKTDGFSNSAQCQQPHLSISGDTTKAELFRKMPSGSDENGFGNRFLYCYVYRTKKCPLGGPQIDWAEEVAYLLKVIEFAKQQKYVPLSKAAEKMWSRMYLDLESNRPLGLAGKMTARGPAHVRRLALILALLDMSPVVESRHLQAARRLWDYCQESAEYIFSGCTQDQRKILNFVGARQGVTAAKVREELFQRHQKASWVQAQLSELVRRGNLMQAGEQFKKAA